MRLNELETIYRIFDAGDNNYSEWFGTEDDIVEYLREQQDSIHKYNESDGWCKNLRRYGLTFEVIN